MFRGDRDSAARSGDGRSPCVSGRASPMCRRADGWARQRRGRSVGRCRLLLAGSSPAAGKQWTDDGQHHQPRSLKARAESVKRPVSACPELAAILRAHVDRFGTADDGRLFRRQRGNRLAPVRYESVWRRAREHVLSAAQLATPLAERPCDLPRALTERRRSCGRSCRVLGGLDLGTCAHSSDGDGRLAEWRLVLLATRTLRGGRPGERGAQQLGQVRMAEAVRAVTLWAGGCSCRCRGRVRVSSLNLHPRGLVL